MAVDIQYLYGRGQAQQRANDVAYQNTMMRRQLDMMKETAFMNQNQLSPQKQSAVAVEIPVHKLLLLLPR
jgi:hypothetical protein